MRFREMSIIPRDPAAKNIVKDLSYSNVTVTVGAQLFRRRYASVAQIRP